MLYVIYYINNTLVFSICYLKLLFIFNLYIIKLLINDF